MKTAGLATVGAVLLVLAVYLTPGMAGSASASSVTISITISPNVLMIAPEGTWITVHTDIPFSRVIGSSVSLDGLPAEAVFPDNRGYLVAKFDQAAVEAMVSPPVAVLTLSGMTTDNEPFSGSDTVRVDIRPGDGAVTR